MKSTKITYLILGLTLSASMTSCISDDSKYGGDLLPQLSVPVADPEKMPETNINYGEELEFDPQVKYNGNGQLLYEWSIGTYENGIKGSLKKVSNESVLRYSFPSGGVYYAHLNVTDGAVGLAQDYQINVNRTFEKGWLIVSNNGQKGNLAFIKDRTPEEIAAGMDPIIMENCLERVNDGIPQEKIIGAATIMISWPTSKTRLLVSTESKAFFLDPNTFTAISTIEFNKVIPGFKGQKLLGAAANPRVADFSTGSYVTLNGNDMFGYAEQAMQGRKFDEVFTGSYVAWGNNNFIHAYVSLNPLVLHNNSGYYPYFGNPDWLDSSEMKFEGKPLFQDEELITIFMGEGVPGPYSTSYYMYTLTRNTKTGKIYNTYINDFGDTAYFFNFGYKVEVPTDENSAVPAKSSSIVASDTYHRTYFHDGSKVYVMLADGDSFILPSKNQYSLSFPAGEEITYMSINPSTDELFVATCNSAGRGNVYIYDVADVRTDNPNANPTAKYLNVADRISYMVYKPRV